MKNIVAITETAQLDTIDEIVARLNRVITDLNENAKLAKLTEGLPAKKQVLIRDLALANDAMRLYLSQCESLHTIGMTIMQEYHATPKYRFAKRKQLFADKEENSRHLTRALQYYFNAKTTKESAEASLHNVITLMNDYKSCEEYTNNYRMLAELEYNPLILTLNQKAETSFPTIDLDGKAEYLNGFEVVDQSCNDTDCPNVDDNENSI